MHPTLLIGPADWDAARMPQEEFAVRIARLWKRDGKPRYLDFMPRMWGLLERDLAHPALAPMQGWFDANIPATVRARPLA